MDRKYIATDCTLPHAPTQGSIPSRDGTPVGFRCFGSGRAIILLHGGMMTAQNFRELASTLASSFCVYVPDRRGRGASGPYGPAYSVRRDCEDVLALAEHTGAERIFGLSSGAIIALETALLVPPTWRVAAYEPPYSIAGRDNAAWLERFDHEVRAGDLASAFVTVLRGTAGPAWLAFIPRPLLAALFAHALRHDLTRGDPSDVPLKTLIPTMHSDALIVRETTPGIERLRAIQAEVLLMTGSRSPAFLRSGVARLFELIPKAKHVELPGVGHTAADNRGQPALVAEALRQFFE
jgi:pimeloyl-ACP methyl ester carboxylesterase